jgi:hypothetical protein
MSFCIITKQTLNTLERTKYEVLLWDGTTTSNWNEKQNAVNNEDDDNDALNDDDQWRYSPDRALGSLYGFHDSFIVRCGVISSTIDLF